jgi:hypothetical protein
VQRWEREFSLPVRRIGSPGSEVVFAFRHEVDAWLESGGARAAHDAERPLAPAETTSPTGEKSRGLLVGLSALALAVFGLAAAWSWSVGLHRGPRAPVSPAAGRQPARWDVVDRGLEILDHGGGRVCTIAFDVPVSLVAYEATPTPFRQAVDLDDGSAGSKSLVQVVDLDGDGRREVVVARAAIDFRDRSLAVYDDGCRLRWSDTSQPAAVFGGVPYGPPYHVLWVKVTKADGQGWVVWASRRHSKYFPSVLQKFDAQGRLLGEYWHPGEITDVATGGLAGRSSIVIGGVNNELRRPFAAKYDAAAAAAVGPASSAAYRCTSCPAHAVAPQAYVLFPPTELGTLSEGMASLKAVRLDHQWITVEVYQYSLPGLPIPVVATTTYDLDSRLVPIRAALSDGYEVVWRHLYERGILRHPFGPAERAAVWDVRQWDGAAFRPLVPSPQAVR